MHTGIGSTSFDGYREQLDESVPWRQVPLPRLCDWLDVFRDKGGAGLLGHLGTSAHWVQAPQQDLSVSYSAWFQWTHSSRRRLDFCGAGTCNRYPLSRRQLHPKYSTGWQQQRHLNHPIFHWTAFQLYGRYATRWQPLHPVHHYGEDITYTKTTCC